MSSSIEEGPKEGITFAHQDKLPKLPIPDLESTCEKYLAALKPLQSAREHAKTKLAVDDFLKGEGPELNERLRRYAEGKTSYIEQFWYDSYLNFDNPVVLNLNPFFLLEDDPTPARNNQVTRAASLVVSALEFVRAVRKEELPPDFVKGQPLDMYQVSRLFGTARVPTDAGCQIEQDPESTHVVVMCHGQFYWFDVMDANSDVIMTERDIAINLQTIIDDAQQTPIQEAAKGALGVLSTENRKVWSGLRDVLTRQPGSNNADCLSIVDSALFMICLDYTEPATAAALCQNMLCGTSEIERGVQIGTCTNRWYDKLQIIVCKNGSAGINFEHTGVDGHTVLRFASDVYTDTILRFARTINGQALTLWKSTSPDPSRRDPASFCGGGDGGGRHVFISTTPRKLEWDMTPELAIAVRFAETRLADLIEQNEFQCLDFGGYGKRFITSMGLSPDAFVQMAFQAAYYGLYGRIECTYEPAMTKAYLHGRTEAVRPVSDESVAFVQTFWADNPARAKVEALRRACQRHVDSTRDCARGRGCDRHLYALFCLWQRTLPDDDELGGGASSEVASVNGYPTADSSPASPSAAESGSGPARDQPPTSPSVDGSHSASSELAAAAAGAHAPAPALALALAPAPASGHMATAMTTTERQRSISNGSSTQSHRQASSVNTHQHPIRSQSRSHRALSPISPGRHHLPSHHHHHQSQSPTPSQHQHNRPYHHPSPSSRNHHNHHAHHQHSPPMPAVFADAGWDRLNTTILSTSNCGNPSLRQFGFGPVSGDGFGIGYIIKDDRIACCVSSKHRQTHRFVDTLESYLLEIRRQLRMASTSASAGTGIGTGITRSSGAGVLNGVSAGGRKTRRESASRARMLEVTGSGGGNRAGGGGDGGRRGGDGVGNPLLPAISIRKRSFAGNRNDNEHSSNNKNNLEGRTRGGTADDDDGEDGLADPDRSWLPPRPSGTAAASDGNAASSRMKSRGRALGPDYTGGGPTKWSAEEGEGMSDDEELGGYGFFDAGMLLQALRARGNKDPEGRDTKPTEHAAVQARRRADVGKKLRLVDY